MTYLLRDLPISAKEYAFGRSKIFIRLFGSIYYNVVEDDDNGDDGDLHQVVGGGRPAGGVAEGQTGGAGGADPEDLERVISLS